MGTTCMHLLYLYLVFLTTNKCTKAAQSNFKKALWNLVQNFVILVVNFFGRDLGESLK